MKKQRWQLMVERPDFPNGGWMLYCADFSRRHEGSAGGVVTELTRFLLEQQKVKTALGFDYDTEAACFSPKWMYSPEEVFTAGSIYHEIALIKFLYRSIDAVVPPLLITTLPCQVAPVRAICKKFGIPVHIVSLVCSGQLTLDATKDLFRRVANGRQVIRYRYRGGGWPSGVRIQCSDGEEIFLENNSSIWTDIFHSAVFNLSRCFKCKDTFGMKADVTIGDPWLPRYVQNETEGVSMCIPHNLWATELIDWMMSEKRLALQEIINSEEILRSQQGTLEKKAVYRSYPKTISFLVSLYKSSIYQRFVYKRNIKRHLWFHKKYMAWLKRC